MLNLNNHMTMVMKKNNELYYRTYKIFIARITQARV